MLTVDPQESCRWGGRGGSLEWSFNSTWKGSVETLQGLPLDNVDPGGGRLHMVNLERIHKDIARITSDNVDHWGVNQWSTW